MTEAHYLKKELDALIQNDPEVFRFIEEGMLDGLWFWDLENPEHEWLSPKFKAVFGYEAHEMAHSPDWWQKNAHPDDLPHVLANFNAHAADPNVPFDNVLRYRHRDNSTVWIRCRGMAIRDPQGKPIRMIGAHTNVTELQHARQELQRLYEQTPALLHSIDHNGCIELVSDRWLEHFGYKRDEVIGRRSTEFLTEDSRRKAIEEILPEFFRTGACEDIAYEWLCQDGSIRQVQLSATVQRDQKGHIIRSLAIMQDTTALHRAEEQAGRERAQRERLFESTKDAVVMADDQRHIIELNTAAENLFGWATADLKGKPTSVLYADQDDFEHRGRTHFNTTVPLSNDSYQVPYKRRDGTIFLGETVGGVFNDERTGKPIGFFGIIRDVTAQVEARQELEEANKRLELSLEALDQFAHIASHDLHTPLRGIQNVINFIQEDTSPALLDEIAPRLTQIQERAKYMDTLLRSLLQFARADLNGHQAEEVDCVGLMDTKLLRLQADLAQMRPFEVTVEYPEPLPKTLHLSATVLRHVLRNIITNAVVHHDRDKAHVNIRVCFEDNMLRIDISDDGPGIPQRHHARIFQLFQTLSRDKTSTGMGLALVQHSLMRAGGQISVHSPLSAQRGTRFSISLPAQGEHQ